MTESETNKLIEKAIGGDQDAMLEVLLNMKARLNRFVAMKLSDSPKVKIYEDDILQETYIKACREFGSLRITNDKGLMAWLKAIALNEIRIAARRVATIKRGGDRARIESNDLYSNRALCLVLEMSDPGIGTPSTFVARQEAIDAIRIALSRLPDDQRQAMQYHYFQQFTVQETAEKMDRTSDSVRGLVQRAKKSLRNAMVTSSLWLSRKG